MLKEANTFLPGPLDETTSHSGSSPPRRTGRPLLDWLSTAPIIYNLDGAELSTAVATDDKLTLQAVHNVVKEHVLDAGYTNLSAMVLSRK